MESVVSAMEARRNFGQLLEKTYYRDDVFVIQRATKPMAVLVPLTQYRQWQLQRGQFFALINKVQERTRQETVGELEDAIAEAVAAAKQNERGIANSEARGA